MTQYNRVNVKLSNLKLNKLKSAIKNETDVVIRTSPNMIRDTNDQTNFPHELLLADRQVSSIRKAFSNNSSADIKFSKTQLSQMIQSGGFLGKLLGPLLKTGLRLIKNVITPIAKSVLIPLGLTAAASAADVAIHKKILGSGNTTLITSNKDIEDLVKIVKSLEDSGILVKGVTESVQNEVKEQKEEIIWMQPHPLTNFEIKKFYENKSRFNGVYSRDNLPNKLKDGAYVINLDDYSDIGTHWVALWVNINNITYFDSFGVEHIPKEIKASIKNRNFKTNIFRIRAYDSIMCGYFCIGFIDFMLSGKTLTEFTYLFSPNNYKENDNIILNYFISNI